MIILLDSCTLIVYALFIATHLLMEIDMNTFMITSSLASGVSLIFYATMMKTGNVQSTILFKTVPVLLGLGSLFVGLKLLGWI